MEAGEIPEGYGPWFCVLRDRRPVLVGSVGCFPTEDGKSAMLGYETLPEFEGQGFGTESAQAMLGWLFGHEELKRVSAETFPDHGASIRILQKLGFAQVGPGKEEGSLRFEAVRR